MVTVPRTKLIAWLVALALFLGPAGVAGALTDTAEDVEPECRPAEDGSGAYLCQLPEECQEDADLCPIPDECERVDDAQLRCVPPDDVTTTTASTEANTTEAAPEDAPTREDLITSGDPQPSEVGRSAADCTLDRETHEVVCEPREECRSGNLSEVCRPPSGCQRADDGLVRCQPDRGGPPDHAHSQGEARSSEDRNDRGERGERQPDRAQEDEQCREGPKAGTMICKPPTECEGKLGSTAACTPPPECEPREDGTYLCQMPGPQMPEDVQGSQQTENRSPVGEGDDIVPQPDPETRQQAREAIAEALQQAAQSFDSRLDELREEYQQGKEKLRADYQESKDQLRSEYQQCREDIDEGANVSQRNDELRACMQEAREGLEQLREQARSDHAELKRSMKDKAEQAREKACQKAENQAFDAIAEHGLFDTDPAELVPEGASDLCPSIATTQGGA